MPLKKKKKFIQRLQHIVRFDIAFDAEDTKRDISKPLINFVQAGSISDKKLLIGDLILSINNINVKTIGDLDFEINKVDWGDVVLFEVKRFNNDIPIGQRLVLERICDSWKTKKSIVLFVNVNIKNDIDYIPLKDGYVTKYYINGKWSDLNTDNKITNVLNRLGNKWNINKLKI